MLGLCSACTTDTCFCLLLGSDLTALVLLVCSTYAVTLVMGLVLSMRFMMPAMTLLGPIS